MHGHVSGFLKAAQARPDVQIVGVFDSDPALLRKYAERYKLPEAVLFSDAGAMITATKPEAVAAFTNTYDHPQIVELAAAHRVHVMMEKPLAVSNAHAQRIRTAAEKGRIQVMEHLTAVVRGTRQVNGLSSLENGLIATEILEAARESARTGQRVALGAATSSRK